MASSKQHLQRALEELRKAQKQIENGDASGFKEPYLELRELIKELRGNYIVTNVIKHNRPRVSVAQEMGISGGRVTQIIEKHTASGTAPV
jgi:hypothetical protein